MSDWAFFEATDMDFGPVSQKQSLTYCIKNKYKLTYIPSQAWNMKKKKRLKKDTRKHGDSSF